MKDSKKQFDFDNSSSLIKKRLVFFLSSMGLLEVNAKKNKHKTATLL